MGLSDAELKKCIVGIIRTDVAIDRHENLENKDLEGTGFFISKDGYLATCAHVVEDHPETVKISYQGNIHVVRKIPCENNIDFALLKLDNADHYSISYATLRPEPDGDRDLDCRLYGHAHGNLDLTGFSGELGAHYENYIELIPKTGQIIEKGHSGSPVRYNGAIVGICAAYKQAKLGYLKVGKREQEIIIKAGGFAIPSSKITALLPIIYQSTKEKYMENMHKMLGNLGKFHHQSFELGKGMKLIRDRSFHRVKWVNNRYNSNGKKCYINQILSQSKMIGVMAAMGAGKSTMVYQMLSEYKYSPETLPIYIELLRWNETLIADLYKDQKIQYHDDSHDRIVGMAYLTMEAWKANMEFREFYEFISQTLKGSFLLILEGLDELGDRGQISSFCRFIQRKEKGKLLITGRDHAFRKYEESPNTIELNLYRLDDFSDNQVETYLGNFNEQFGENRQYLSVRKLSKLAPYKNHAPELSYRNPLVLQAILFSRELLQKEEELDEVDILQSIANRIFSWYVGSTLDKKPEVKVKFDITSNDDNELNVDNNTLKSILMDVFTQISIDGLEDREIKSIDPFIEDLGDELHGFIRTLLQSNHCMLHRTGRGYIMLPDRMIDYFILRKMQNVSDETSGEIISTLSKIIGNSIVNHNLLVMMNKSGLTQFLATSIDSAMDLGINHEIKFVRDTFKLVPYDVPQDDRCKTSNNKIVELNLTNTIAHEVLWTTSKIKSHPKDAIEKIMSLSELKLLDFSYNNLYVLPDNIGNLANLTYLDLTANKLNSLPSSIWKLTNLKELHIQVNNLTVLSPEVGNLSQLQLLQIAGNNFQSLPNTIGNLSNLRTLIIAGNSFTEIPDEIGNLTNLERLDMDNCKLQKIPNTICNLEKLQELRLFSNQLVVLPNCIGNLSNLRVLDLNNNRIKDFPKSIEQLVSLKRLKFLNNPMAPHPKSLLKFFSEHSGRGGVLQGVNLEFFYDPIIRIGPCVSEMNLDEVWKFLEEELELSVTHPRNFEFYKAQFLENPEYLLMAIWGYDVIGAAFGHINEDGNLLVGEIAVAEFAQHQKIGSKMLQKMEIAAKKRGVGKIVLGGLGKISPFYLKSGYTANLYIQTEEPPSIKELLALNPGLPFTDRSLDDGWSRLLLFTNGVDNKLEMKFKDTFPNISTIYIYEKVL